MYELSLRLLKQYQRQRRKCNSKDNGIKNEDDEKNNTHVAEVGFEAMKTTTTNKTMASRITKTTRRRRRRRQEQLTV